MVNEMRLTNQVRKFLVEEAYYIDIYDQHIHVFHYIDILKLQDNHIILQMDGFVLNLEGRNFRVKQLENQEILIRGDLERLSFS